MKRVHQGIIVDQHHTGIGIQVHFSADTVIFGVFYGNEIGILL